MSDTATAPAQACSDVKAGGLGRPPGRLIVGDYVGVLAAQAAQAVRRAGLTPGVDRSFGCKPALIGVVIAQEPVAGSELARNGMVTLYAGVPEAVPTTEADREPTGGPVELREAAPPAAVAAEMDVHVPPRGMDIPRRGKPGHDQTRPAHVFDPPPDPKAFDPDVRSPEADGLEQPPPESQPTPTDDDTRRDGGSPQAELFEPTVRYASGALLDQDLVARTADVFAGHTAETPAWPSARSRAVRGVLWWARGHLVLTVTVAAMVVTWIVVAVLVAHANPRVQANATQPPSPASGATRRPIAKTRPTTPSRVQGRGRTHRVTQAQQQPDSPRPPRAPAATAAANASSPPAAAAPQSAATAAAPQSEGQQTGGGPFSP